MKHLQRIVLPLLLATAACGPAPGPSVSESGRLLRAAMQTGNEASFASQLAGQGSTFDYVHGCEEGTAHTRGDLVTVGVAVVSGMFSVDFDLCRAAGATMTGVYERTFMVTVSPDNEAAVTTNTIRGSLLHADSGKDCDFDFVWTERVQFDPFETSSEAVGEICGHPAALVLQSAGL